MKRVWPVAIVWVATFKETRRHAHLNGYRVCRDARVLDPRHWLRIKAQPLLRCAKCLEALLGETQDPPRVV